MSQFLRLGCVLYATVFEANWCTEASAALLLSIDKVFWPDIEHFISTATIQKNWYNY